MHTHDDTQLTDAVRRALAAHLKDAGRINVTAEHGAVTLSGTVASENERQLALSTTQAVPGVNNVKNDLCVAGKDDQTVGEYVDDALITSAVKGKLLTEAGIKSFSISVETNQGVVVLTGNVDKLEHASLAEQVARAVNGVKRVDNRLVYKP